MGKAWLCCGEDEQRAVLESSAREQGYEIIGSTADHDRQGLSALLDAVHEGKVQVVFVKNYDRFMADPITAMGVANLLQMENVKTVFMDPEPIGLSAADFEQLGHDNAQGEER